VGVLTLPDGKPGGSIAMRRVFNAKLSVSIRTRRGIVSSGYSQGLIDDFPDIRETCEQIALKSGSTGPFNVQGRRVNGRFVPFEINPRFSATAYLRAMAGFNEADLYVRYCENGVLPRTGPVHTGYYFRSLTETYVPQERIKA
jgi:carbamoyl-phosphate synthase large subunit